MKKLTFGIASLFMIVLAGCSEEGNRSNTVNHQLESETSIVTTNEPTMKSEATRLSDLASQEFNADDHNTITSFGKAFINLYTGAVAAQEAVSFNNYISNANLLQYTNKMLELEQKQLLSGGNSAIFGLDNEFEEPEIKQIKENLYYVNIPFSNQGSHRTCQQLIQYENQSLKMVDVYFGNKDGVDTLVTGHPSERKLDHAALWDDPEWVDRVFEKLEQYESELN